MTLDHVTPRRGQSAYDRRDNLVLACKRCNTAKADKSFVAYLLAQRSRAANLLHFGDHLSEGIIALVRHMANGTAPTLHSVVHPNGSAATRPVSRSRYASDDGDESPYRETESPYRLSA